MTGSTGRAGRWRALVPCVLLLTACTPAISGTPQEQNVSVPLAPYVYVGAGTLGLMEAVRDTPARRFTLAFVLADQGRCAPTWGEGRSVRDPALLAEIAEVRDAGGSVSIATGGASGTYLESSCATAPELANAYGDVLTATGADTLDVDIEKDVSADLVADALTLLDEDREVAITITLGVASASEGLDTPASALLQALAGHGADVTVNAMVMNFPEAGTRQESLLGAAEAVTGQIERLWPGGGRGEAYRRLGLTLMAGRDDTGELTTLADARAVRTFARNHAIGSLGLWSLARDNGDCPDDPTARDDCSGISQNPFDFTRSLS